MPRGTRHVESGLLMQEGPWLVLQRDLGGTWRLDAPARARKLLGRRVQIEGIRAGFDLLNVEKLELASSPTGPAPDGMASTSAQS